MRARDPAANSRHRREQDTRFVGLVSSSYVIFVVIKSHQLPYRLQSGRRQGDLRGLRVSVSIFGSNSSGARRSALVHHSIEDGVGIVGEDARAVKLGHLTPARKDQ